MTFLIAGHETISISTCWALHLLSKHPHEQDKFVHRNNIKDKVFGEYLIPKVCFIYIDILSILQSYLLIIYFLFNRILQL
jgi:cytochrome P450